MKITIRSNGMYRATFDLPDSVLLVPGYLGDFDRLRLVDIEVDLGGYTHAFNIYDHFPKPLIESKKKKKKKRFWFFGGGK